MSNDITASIEFYYKGKKYSTSIKLDMDQHMHTSGELADLFPLLAKAMNIGPYTYEYEMMLAETIVFSEARGLIANFVNDGILDFTAFNVAWSENIVIEKLQEIAKEYLAIDDINQQPDIKSALLHAYQLGKKEKGESEGCSS